MAGRITTWSLHEGQVLVAQIMVHDPDLDLSASFYRHKNRRWSRFHDKVEPVKETVRLNLDRLVAEHPVLGAHAVQKHMGYHEEETP